MICVADSGSTKTDWVFAPMGSCDQDEWIRLSSQGLNPFYVSSKEVEHTIEKTIPEDLLSQVTNVFFYGAGCSSEERKSLIAKGIQPKFVNAKVEVEHDLLAAARASCQNETGVVSILGTGSNSCKYDGLHIIDNVSNLGFLLGDEGSGGDIGRYLVKARCYREMPPKMEEIFDQHFDFDKERMLDQVYHRPMANRYMASFAPFAAKYIQEPFIRRLVKSTFESFADRHLIKYDVPNWEHHFIGSIAASFEDVLVEVLNERGLRMGRIVRHPVNALLKYHLKGYAI